MAISDKIQQVMKERNISYAELSRMTGIAPSSMQSYGSGRSKKIPFHVIETLSEKLHLPIEFWLGDEQIAETRVSHELAEEVRNPSVMPFWCWLHGFCHHFCHQCENKKRGTLFRCLTKGDKNEKRFSHDLLMTRVCSSGL